MKNLEDFVVNLSFQIIYSWYSVIEVKVDKNLTDSSTEKNQNVFEEALITKQKKIRQTKSFKFLK